MDRTSGWDTLSKVLKGVRGGGQHSPFTSSADIIIQRGCDVRGIRSLWCGGERAERNRFCSEVPAKLRQPAAVWAGDHTVFG